MQRINQVPTVSEKARAAGLLAQAGALLACALGLAVLLGWVLEVPPLSGLDSHWVPMAPSTALLFALLGATLFLSARMPGSHALRRATLVTAIAVALLALVLFVLYWTGVRADVEHFGLNVADSLGGVSLGHMSPVTAAWFMLASASLIATLSATRPGQAMAGFWLACSGIAAGAFFLLAYLFGRPLLYGGEFIPPALTTCAAFMALGISLAASAAPRAWQLDDEIDAASRQFARFLVFVFALLAAGMIAVGYLYIKSHEDQYRTIAGRELSAIADLKADDLARWRAERLADAAVNFRNDAFTGLVRRALADPRDPQAQKQLQEWLRLVVDTYHYDHVMLSDARGVARLTIPERVHTADADRQIGDALGWRQAGFLDFHRDRPEGAPHLAILVPILDASSGDALLGMLYVAIDPEHSLYPFVRRWPTLSRTAETLLVRREGNDALFLNELRFQKGTALTLRIPLTSADVPAVKAVLGQEGIVEGIDYRGVSVIAGLRKVPGSPWFLVARMDTVEALAPAYETLWLTTGLVGALLLAAAGAMGFAWRHQRARHYRERFRAAEELAASLARHRAVTQTATDAIVTADAAGRIVGWNPAAERMFGYSEPEVLGESLIKLMPERYHERHQAGIARMASGGGARVLFRTVELHGLTGAGSEFPMELSLSEWDTAEGTFFTGIVRDISERKRAQIALARRNDLYNLLSQTNQMIVRITNRDELLPKICRNAVESGGFLFAWIGTISAQNGRVQPEAQFGEDHGYVDAIRRSALQSDPAGWNGPLGQALRAGEHVISNDFLNDANVSPWYADAERAGVRAAAVFPLRQDKAVIGAICLYSGVPGYFSEDLLPTLDEMALDVSFALSVYARDAASKLAHEAAREREALYQSVIATSLDGFCMTDLQGRLLDVNDAYVRMSGYTREELLTMQIADLDATKTAGEFAAQVGRCMHTGGELFESVHRAKNGTLRQVEINVHYGAAGGGRLFVFVRDIYQRKRIESLKKMQLQFSELMLHGSLDDLLQAVLAAAEMMTGSRIGFFHFVDPDEEHIRLQAWSADTLANHGCAQRGAQHLPVSEAGVWADCVRTRKPVIHNDYASLAHRKGLPEGHAPVNSELTVPVLRRGRVAAIIGVGNKAESYTQSDVDSVSELGGIAIELIEGKHAEELLRASEAHLHVLFEYSPVPVWELDLSAVKVHLDSLRLSSVEALRANCDAHPEAVSHCASLVKIVDVNRTSVNFFGGGNKQDIMTNLANYLVPDSLPVFKNKLFALALGRTQFEGDMPMRMLGGATRTLSLSLVLVPGAEKTWGRVLVSFMDLTERKRLEEAHLQAQKLGALGTLAGGIAHDFNNILSAIRGNADLAAEDVGPDHAAAPSLAEIRKASARASELVRRITAFARPGDVQQQVVDLSAVVDEVLNLLRSTLPAGLSLSRNFAADTPHVLADSGQIHEAIVNLTTNAAYAIGTRAGTIDYRLEPVNVDAELARRIPGIEEGRYARLTVTDNGCGMDTATLGRIFDAFYTTKPVNQGTGLGLSMLHGIMRSHGGAVTVQSTPGEGSSFALYFPAAGAQARKDEQGAPAQIERPTGQRVLYVDDEEALVLLASRVLSRLGYRVSSFTDPEEALAAFRAQPQDYDVMVTDLSMPHLSGLELARAVLAVRPEMPVLMTSGYLRAEDEDSAHAAGIRELVLKPVTMDELGLVLDRLFRDAQARD